MAERLNRSGLRCSAARAGTGLNAGSRAGRLCGYSPLAIVMAKCIYISINVAVTAAAAGMSRVTLFSAGRRRNDCRVIMAKRLDRSRLGRSAAAADMGLDAGFRAGRLCGYSPLAIVMAKCIYISINVAVTAAAAGMGRVALFRAGRRRNDCRVIMAERLNRSAQSTRSSCAPMQGSQPSCCQYMSLHCT